MKCSKKFFLLTILILPLFFFACDQEDMNEDPIEQNDSNSNNSSDNNEIQNTFDPDDFWSGRWKPTAPNDSGPIIYTITPNTDRGYFRNTQFGNWQSVANAGLIQHNSLKWANMVMVNEDTWFCNTLWVRWEGQEFNSTPVEVAYAPATITITSNTENHKSIKIESIDPWGTTSEIAYYVRQPY